MPETIHHYERPLTPPPSPPRDLETGVCHPPGTVCQPHSPASGFAPGRVDQSAETGPGPGACAGADSILNYKMKCLKVIDNFRTA
jgi:hypothetical protein